MDWDESDAFNVDFQRYTETDAPECGYYVAGSRIPLDVVVNEFRRGRTPEAILGAYPTIGSLATVYGTVTFILKHPSETEGYLADQERAFEDVKRRYPMPPDLIDCIERARRELSAKRS